MFKFWMGLLMDEAGGGDGGGGGADTGGSVDLGGGADTGSESTALTVQGDQSLATTDDLGGDDTQDTSVERFQPFENGRLSKKAIETLAPIKKASPQLHQSINRALNMQSRLYSMFQPGVNPFEAIKSYQRIMKELGGEQGIQEIRNSLAEMETLDLQYSDGDPRFLDQMTGTPEGKASFVKIAPFVLNKLEQLGAKNPIIQMRQKFLELWGKFAPNSLTRYLAGTVKAELMDADVQVHVRRLASFAPKDDPIAQESAQALTAWFNRIGELSALVPEQAEALPATTGPDPRDQELSQREQRLQQTETQLKVTDWNGGAMRLMGDIINEEWAKQTKGLKMNEVQAEDLKQSWRRRANIALTGNGNNAPLIDLNINHAFYDRGREFFKNNDKNGWERFLSSQLRTAVPRALKAEIQRRGLAGKTTAPGTTTTVTAAGATKVTPEAGFKTISGKPPYNDVKRPETTGAMFQAGQAILKAGNSLGLPAGSKVQWGIKRA